MHLRTLFHSQSGDMGIGNQVGADSSRSKVLLQECEMLRARIKRFDMVTAQPIPNTPNRLLHCQWVCHYPRMSSHPDKSNYDKPWQANLLRSVN